MNQDRTNRKLAAIFSTDVVGYSRLMESDEAWTIQNLEENKKLMSSLIEEYKGRVVDSPGDNLLAEFGSVINAVECAVKIQKQLNKKNSKLMEDHRMNFRIGVNLGDVVEEDGKLYGNGVNIAARLEGLAEPGGICVSHTAYDQVKSKIEVDYDYLGEYKVKNINEPVRVYRIHMGGESTEKYVPSGKSQRKLIPLSIAMTVIVFLLTALGTTIAILYPKPTEPLQVMRSYQELPEIDEFNIYQPFIAIAPDGSKFVYCSTKGLYVRLLKEWDARLIPGTNDRPISPVFSPNGEWIVYWSQLSNQLKKIAISGATPTILATDFPVIGSLSWNTDDTIMYGYDDTIWRISANGGDPEPFFKMEGNAIANPQLLPDGNSVIFSSATEGSKTVIHSLKTGENKVLLRQGSSARYVKTGHIIYCVDKSLYAVPFDIDTLKLTGSPVNFINDLMYGSSDFHQYAVSESGMLIYASTEADVGDRLVWVDRTGNEEVLFAEPKNYQQVKISPDGKKVALSIDEGENDDIWVWDFVSENPTRLTFDDADDGDPLWTIDSKRIVFSSDRGGKFAIYWKAANGTGTAEPFYSLKERDVVPVSFSADGAVLSLITRREDGVSGISALFLKKDRQLKDLLYEVHTEAQTGGVISPDGRWLAYQSEAEEKVEIFVSPFPDVKSAKWKISKGGGYYPLWSPDGLELYYRNRNEVIAVPIEANETFNHRKPAIIFDGIYFPYNFAPYFGFSWDIHPDGKHFLMIKPDVATAGEDVRNVSSKIKIVTNWFEELKQRVPVD